MEVDKLIEAVKKREILYVYCSADLYSLYDWLEYSVSEDSVYWFCMKFATIGPMSDFKAKMHQIRFRMGLRPRPRWGSLQRSPDPLAGFRGLTSKGEGKGGKGRDGRGGLDPQGFSQMTPLILSKLTSELWQVFRQVR